jgi:hypothetical protein
VGTPGTATWTPTGASTPVSSAGPYVPAPAGDSGSADWLGELRGDTPPSSPDGRSPGQPWGPGFGADQAAAATIVPVLGRAAKRQRKVAEKARTAEAKATIKSMRRAAGSDPTPPPPRPPAPAPAPAPVHAPVAEPVPPAFEADAHYADLDDLDETDRSRWVSLLVFWAPALILLMLAGVVIWLVR